VTLVVWNLVSIHSEIVLVSVQDRCTVSAKHRSEIVLVCFEIVLTMMLDWCTFASNVP
jgi:hypothetical protein